MNRVKAIIVILLIFMTVQCAVGQQIPQFSQYLFNPIYINPAYTGYKNDLFVQSFYRRQWSGIKGAPETYGIAADAMLPSQKLGIGVIAMGDQIGLQSTHSLYANAAYHLQLGADSYLSFGTGLGLVNYRMNSEDYDPAVIDDSTLSPGGGSIFYPDLRLGLLFYSEYVFLGISVDQVLGNMLNFENTDLIVNPQRSYTFSLGGIINVTDRLYLKPSVLLMDDSRAMTRADFNLLFMYDEAIGVGIGHRRSFHLFDRPEYVADNNNVGLLVLTEIRLGESLRLGYSFDYPMAGLWVGNSHELSLGFLVTSRRSRLRSPRYF